MLGLRGVVPEAGPQRALTMATIISSFGFAAFTTASGLFFVRFIRLTPQTVGFGLAAAGVVALGSPLLFGRLADRVDPRALSMWLSGLQAVFVGCYAFSRSTAAFVVVATAVAFVDRATWLTRNVLTATMVGPEARVRFKAQQRAAFNVGASLGALAAAVPLQIGTRSSYLVLLIVYVLTSAASAVCVAMIPRSTAVRPPVDRGWTALRDPAYVGAALVSGLLMLHHSLLFIALPLWVVRSTAAPPSAVGLLVALNTVLAVAFQVRLSAGGESVTGAARAARRGGLILLPACLLLGAAAHANAVWAVMTLAGGVVLLTAGELLTVTGSWGLSYGLAPDALMGQYQGVFSLGVSIENVVGPVLATSVVVGWGFRGWALLGACFLVLGLLIVPVVAWGVRTRSPAGPSEIAPVVPA
jgi:hypothetical protein